MGIDDWDSIRKRGEAMGSHSCQEKEAICSFFLQLPGFFVQTRGATVDRRIRCNCGGQYRLLRRLHLHTHIKHTHAQRISRTFILFPSKYFPVKLDYERTKKAVDRLVRHFVSRSSEFTAVSYGNSCAVQQRYKSTPILTVSRVLRHLCCKRE